MESSDAEHDRDNEKNRTLEKVTVESYFCEYTERLRSQIEDKLRLALCEICPELKFECLLPAQNSASWGLKAVFWVPPEIIRSSEWQRMCCAFNKAFLEVIGDSSDLDSLGKKPDKPAGGSG